MGDGKSRLGRCRLVTFQRRLTRPGLEALPLPETPRSLPTVVVLRLSRVDKEEASAGTRPKTG